MNRCAEQRIPGNKIEMLHHVELYGWMGFYCGVMVKEQVKKTSVSSIST